MKNRCSVEALNLSPTRSSVCDMHPISNAFGYTTLTMCIAATFTLAQSCMTPNNLLLSMPSVTDSILINSLASSSPLTLFCRNSR